MTKKVVLAHERGVPADCAVLVVAGPQADLLPPVVEAVRAYVAAGGKALVMAEPPLQEGDPQPGRDARGLEPGGRARRGGGRLDGQLFGASTC